MFTKLVFPPWVLVPLLGRLHYQLEYKPVLEPSQRQFLWVEPLLLYTPHWKTFLQWSVERCSKGPKHIRQLLDPGSHGQLRGVQKDQSTLGNSLTQVSPTSFNFVFRSSTKSRLVIQLVRCFVNRPSKWKSSWSSTRDTKLIFLCLETADHYL